MHVRTTLALALLLAGTATAQPVTLAWKFTKGDEFYVVTKTTMTVVMTVKGQKTKQDLEQQGVVLYKVKDAVPGKSVVLEQTVLSIKQKGEAVNQRVAEKIQGITFLITLGAENKLTKFEGYEDFLDKISDGNPTTRQIVETILPEDTLKLAIQETFTSVPGKEKNVNDTWSQKEKQKVSLGPLGDLTSSTTYKYEGKQNADGRMLDKVSCTADIVYKTPGEQPGKLPFKIITTKRIKEQGTERDEVVSYLNAKNFKGGYLFDAMAGRLVKADSEMDLSGKLTFNYDGREVEVGVVMEFKQSSQVSATKPTLDD